MITLDCKFNAHNFTNAILKAVAKRIVKRVEIALSFTRPTCSYRC